MSESIESLRRATVEVVDLPTKALKPDPANPNRIEPELMEALKRDIAENGFVQPVVVRPDGGEWWITDGEHRWRVLKALGSPTVPCVVDDGVPDEAKMRMLTLNALRGRPKPVALAKELVRLAEKLSPEELQRRLGMPEEEYEDAIQLADAPSDEALERALAKEAENAPEVMRFRVGPRQARQIEAALDSLVAAEDVDSRAEALLALLAQA
jgi:ParB/RepB/Spo0J family partition protein